ncbi:hydrogenase expression/formation protein HypE [bacterium SM23_57]|nr:MAG: hydrogenase expression/formation protein HypE [bacterium SM23_57]
MQSPDDFTPACPLPISDYPIILLAHGGGGRLMHQLIESVFVSSFDNPTLNAKLDSAFLHLSTNKIAFTTDSYVVNPLFFPGCDIGTLAINGTVNDLAMGGARPLYLSAGFILEEGLPTETLWRIAQSMKNSAIDAGVQLVTGDTKVVDKGKGDGLYINTAGIGVIEHDLVISPNSITPGDTVILSGDIGRHGIAVMAVREGLTFESDIESDCAPLGNLVMDLIENGIQIHCMRDLTRGGLGCTLVEIAESAKINIHISETAIPVREDVQGACEILGLDPIYIANEGRFMCIVPSDQANNAIDVMQANSVGKGASVIGKVSDETEGVVLMSTAIGTTRVIDMPSGEQLPRIC